MIYRHIAPESSVLEKPRCDGCSSRHREPGPRHEEPRLPDRPVFAIDLCSGLGDSTAVLAYYCAPRSEILGLEFQATFVEHARRRAFWNRDALRNLAGECRRVLRPDGLALIDAEHGGVGKDELVDAFRTEGFRCVGQARSCWLDLGRQLCLRKNP